MKQNGIRTLILFLAAWTGLNLCQAAFTGLDPDEAYYWMYSRDLAWGYFDHPPAVALMIRVGYALTASPLGVRLMSALLSTASFFLVWLLADRPREPRRLGLLLLLLAAMPMLEVYGFIATPDSPLLFFTTLFFWLYRRFLQRDTWGAALALGACMAALLYSKYHGILIIGFAVLSNLTLFRKPKFYVAAVFGAALFFPHLYWQYSHDFPSVRYHLSGRDDPYELKHTITYVLNQLVLFNPLVFPWLMMALWRRRREKADGLQRPFLFITAGFWLFFLWSTAKGHVEPQWTAALSVPLVLTAYGYSVGNDRFARSLTRMAAIGVALLLLIRVAILADWVPPRILNFNNRPFVQQLAREAGPYPIVFVNSYRDPSLLAFFTGKEAHTYRTIKYRPNQFDLWSGESRLQNQRVLLAHVAKWSCTDCSLWEADGKKKKLKWVDSLQVIQKVTLTPSDLPAAWPVGDTVSLAVDIHNPYPHDILLDAGTMPVRPVALFQPALEQWVLAPATFVPALSRFPAGETIPAKIRFVIPAGLPRPFHFGLGLRMGELSPSPHSRLVVVR